MPFPVPGGSNLLAYRASGPHGVIAEYHLAKVEIDGMLETMYKNGQRRLRLPICHTNGGNDGVELDSAGGGPSWQNAQNLVHLLDKIKSVGFEELLVAFMPGGVNGSWITSGDGWNENGPGGYQENWNFICAVKSLVDAAGIPVRYDLLNEGIPLPQQPAQLAYCKRLWSNFVGCFGRDNTIGFSLNVDNLSRIGQMATVYQGTYPWLQDIHFYDPSLIPVVQAALRAVGIDQGWIIGECFYNDADCAATMKTHIRACKQIIFFICQWPITPDAVDVEQNVVPVEFSQYLSLGE
jgi:hypothetical protein